MKRNLSSQKKKRKKRPSPSSGTGIIKGSTGKISCW